MIGLHLAKRRDDAVQVLCLGAHSDDIEIGCGGTLLHLKKAFPRLKVSLGRLQCGRRSWERSCKGGGAIHIRVAKNT